MSILGKIIGLVMPEKGIIAEAKKIQASAQALLNDKAPSKAAMEACHSMMIKHLIKMKLKISAYNKVIRALNIAQSGVGNESQVSKLRAALKNMDDECGSKENLESAVAEFTQVGDLLNKKLNSL